jgi:hypothetical protein
LLDESPVVRANLEAEAPALPQTTPAPVEPSIPDRGLRELVAQQVKEQHKATSEELQKMREMRAADKIEPPQAPQVSTSPPIEPPIAPPPPASESPAVPAIRISPPAPPDTPAVAQAPKVPEPAANPLLEDKAGKPPVPPPSNERNFDITPPNVAPVPNPVAPPSSLIEPPAGRPSTPVPPAPLADPESVVPAGLKITPRPAPAPGSPPPTPRAQDEPAKPAPPSAKNVTSPWTIQVKVVEGRTVLTAYTSKDAQFRLSCDKLDLHAPHGDVKAVGGVTISSAGLEGSCDNLTINLEQDLMLLEGKAQMKCLRDKRELEMKADRFSLRLSESTRGEGAPATGSKGTDVKSDGPSTTGKKQFKVFNLSVYQCRPGDSAAVISRRLYGSEKYAQALLQFNRDYQNRAGLSIVPGVTVYYPQKELLEYSYPDALTRSPGMPQASQSYYEGPSR